MLRPYLARRGWYSGVSLSREHFVPDILQDHIFRWGNKSVDKGKTPQGPCCCSCDCHAVFGMHPWSHVTLQLPPQNKREGMNLHSRINNWRRYMNQKWFRMHCALNIKKSVIHDWQWSGDTNQDISNSRYNVAKRYVPTRWSGQLSIQLMSFEILKWI